MTWLSTWPTNGRPAYAEHATEQQAEAHAAEVVRSGTAAVATAFEAPQDDEHATPGLGDHRGDDRPADNDRPSAKEQP